MDVSPAEIDDALVIEDDDISDDDEDDDQDDVCYLNLVLVLCRYEFVCLAFNCFYMPFRFSEMTLFLFARQTKYMM